MPARRPRRPHRDRLKFRDYLIANPGAAYEYAALKARLAEAHPRDRVAYTRRKSEFIGRVIDALLKIATPVTL